MKEKLRKILKAVANFWYYNKTMTVVCAIAIAAVIFVEVNNAKATPADLGAAIVTLQYFEEDTLKDIKAKLDSRANGDAFSVFYYTVGLGMDNQDENVIGKLDADLISGMSGLIFTDTPKAFEDATNGICLEKDAIPVKKISGDDGLCDLFPDDFYVMVRQDLKDTEKYNRITG